MMLRFDSVICSRSSDNSLAMLW